MIDSLISSMSSEELSVAMKKIRDELDKRSDGLTRTNLKDMVPTRLLDSNGKFRSPVWLKENIGYPRGTAKQVNKMIVEIISLIKTRNEFEMRALGRAKSSIFYQQLVNHDKKLVDTYLKFDSMLKSDKI